MHSRRALPLLASLLLGTAAAAVAGPPPQAPPPPPLPARVDPAGLHAGLDDETRRQVDDAEKVVTFAHSERPAADGGLELVAHSLGALPHPPEAVLSVLRHLDAYPSWVALHPSYKTVRMSGSSRMTAGVGNADATRAKRTMIYDLLVEPAGVTWNVVDSGTPLEAGSRITFEVAPHPTRENWSLLVHRQAGLLPDEGRMTRYLTSEDDRGRNRWWKDANRHARRIHWAVDAAIRHPAGAERRSAYVEHYQREFNGELPVWVR